MSCIWWGAVSGDEKFDDNNIFVLLYTWQCLILSLICCQKMIKSQVSSIDFVLFDLQWLQNKSLIIYHWSQVLLTTTHYLQTLMFVEHWLPSKLNNSLIFELVTDSVLPLNYSVSWCKTEMTNSATLGIIYPQRQTILTRNITSPSLLTLLTSPPPTPQTKNCNVDQIQSG